MNKKPVIVVSATRFFQGGTIVIVNECLRCLSKYYSRDFKIKALVGDPKLYEPISGVEWIAFPNARKSIFHRLYDEYIGFKRLSIEWKPLLWLSLQDSTPNVRAEIRAVYYHNPLLLKPKDLNLSKHQPRLEILRLLYKFVYTRGINKNNFIITQQVNIASYLITHYQVLPSKIRVFPPITYLLETKDLKFDLGSQRLSKEVITKCDVFTFIYPATAFYYKNHSLLLKACQLLVARGITDFKVLLTIDGSENKFVGNLLKEVKAVSQIECIGFQSRKVIYEYYHQVDCMVFPSFLESWGLPLTEFSGFGKPILCADLPYAKETLEGYGLVAFFNPNNEEELADQMELAIKEQLTFSVENKNLPNKDLSQVVFLNTWAALFDLLLKPSKETKTI